MGVIIVCIAQFVWHLEVKSSRSIMRLFINFILIVKKMLKLYIWKRSLVAHGGYYYLCYTVGLIYWGQKVKEHNTFIYTFYINCKKMLKKYIWKTSLVAHGGYYCLYYTVCLTSFTQMVEAHYRFVFWMLNECWILN